MPTTHSPEWWAPSCGIIGNIWLGEYTGFDILPVIERKKMKENKKFIIISAILFVVFAVFTYLVKTVDVQAIGPQNSEVGFAKLNGAVANAIGYNDFFYSLSEVLGYLAIGTVLIFGLFGVMQLFIRKGIGKVDKDLFVLLGLYVLCLLIYVVFEKVIINYRPVILEEGLEASYPSSHTMLAVAFISAAISQFGARFKNEKTKKTVLALCILDGIGVVVCRILAGVHWLTDIIGAIFIALACFFLYFAIFKTVIDKKRNNKEE